MKDDRVRLVKASTTPIRAKMGRDVFWQNLPGLLRAKKVETKSKLEETTEALPGIMGKS